jgi:hypothetical protein
VTLGVCRGEPLSEPEGVPVLVAVPKGLPVTVRLGVFVRLAVEVKEFVTSPVLVVVWLGEAVPVAVAVLDEEGVRVLDGV